jgi:hypothetical protein
MEVNAEKPRGIAFRKGIHKIAATGKKMRELLKGKNLGGKRMGKAVAIAACATVLATGCWAGAGVGENKTPENEIDSDDSTVVEKPKLPGIEFMDDACSENYIEPNVEINDAASIVIDGKGDFKWAETVWADAQTAENYLENGLPMEGYWTVSYEFEEMNSEAGIPEATNENPTSRMDRRELNLHFDLGQWLLVELSYEKDVISLGKTAAHGMVNVGEEMCLPDGKTIELVGVSTELNGNGEHNVIILLKDEYGEPLSEPGAVAPGEIIPIGEYWMKINSSKISEGEEKAYIFLLNTLRTLEGGSIDAETGMHVELDWETGEEYPVLNGFEVYSC